MEDSPLRSLDYLPTRYYYAENKETTIMLLRHALRARRFFPNAPRAVAARQAVAYAKAVAYLGDKWILARPMVRHAN